METPHNHQEEIKQENIIPHPWITPIHDKAIAIRNSLEEKYSIQTFTKTDTGQLQNAENFLSKLIEKGNINDNSLKPITVTK